MLEESATDCSFAFAALVLRSSGRHSAASDSGGRWKREALSTETKPTPPLPIILTPHPLLSRGGVGALQTEPQTTSSTTLCFCASFPATAVLPIHHVCAG